jgi:acetyl-CoA carboxylase biotin carboxyl carrier protein
MNLDEIRQILDLMREHELSEFELEREGTKIRLKKGADAIPVAPPIHAPAPVTAAPSARPATLPNAAAPVAEAAADAGVEEQEEVELAVVKSPIVGTFYRSSEPATPPFVEVGDVVKKGQVLCIIEAMKLMNEIDSEYDGEIVRVYVENGQPVQYGERLFAIKTK